MESKKEARQRAKVVLAEFGFKPKIVVFGANENPVSASFELSDGRRYTNNKTKVTTLRHATYYVSRNKESDTILKVGVSLGFDEIKLWRACHLISTMRRYKELEIKKLSAR